MRVYSVVCTQEYKLRDILVTCTDTCLSISKRVRYRPGSGCDIAENEDQNTRWRKSQIDKEKRRANKRPGSGGSLVIDVNESDRGAKLNP